MSHKSQRRRKLGSHFNFLLPRVFAVDFNTGKIMNIEYICLAQKFCRSKKSRLKARWLKKFNRRLMKMEDVEAC